MKKGVGRSRYTRQYKIRIVKESFKCKNINTFLKDLEMSRSSLYNWIKEYKLKGEEYAFGGEKRFSDFIDKRIINIIKV